VSSEPEIQGFVNALEGHLDECGADEARRGEALIREVEALFRVMEPAVDFDRLSAVDAGWKPALRADRGIRGPRCRRGGPS